MLPWYTIGFLSNVTGTRSCISFSSLDTGGKTNTFCVNLTRFVKSFDESHPEKDVNFNHPYEIDMECICLF